jgi:hypothetical protein
MGKWSRVKGASLVFLSIILLSAFPASGAIIDSMQLGFFSGDYWFNSTGPDAGTFDLDLGDSCFGTITANGSSYNVSCSYKLEAADMLTDMSSGDVAQAQFADNSGGTPVTLTISGEIMEAGFTGTILTAVATSDFLAVETSDVGSTTIDIHQPFQVTGGELATGTETGLQIWNNFIGVYTFSGSSSDEFPGEVRDFQSSIQYAIGNTNVHFEIPEPLSVSLLGLGSLVIWRRRQGSRA